MDEFLTVMEIAETLKLNPQTVRNWIIRGDLPAVRVGARRVRVRRSDWEAFLERSGKTTMTQRAKRRYLVAFGEEDKVERFYEVEASSADQAVNTGLRKWREELGLAAVPQSITVAPAKGPLT